ncbi:Malignant fibrous histiocytoma-amplified sequence 1 [Frankliniella fusca]|uniref:Malignant fibrous histiocytoma-amplified sequence 1 n=1 Tax=Frankliniella fusca TaxID=407009 RepID=A0AAE1H4R5_9NEOP|nr:Malignant fibrous histiocytoma-amplified sequence 1 [Frankliniella fusca]
MIVVFCETTEIKVSVAILGFTLGFTTRPVDLPDNVYLMSVMETVDQTAASRGDLRQLQRGVSAGEQVVQLLGQMVPWAVGALNAELDSSRAQLQQLKKAVQARAPTVKQLKLAVQLEDRHRLLTASKYALLVEDKDGATRRFSLQPVHHLARLIVVLQGALEEDDAEDDFGSFPVGPPSFSEDTPELSFHHHNITSDDQEEMRLCDVNPDQASRVRDMSHLKRLYITTTLCVTASWPGLPLQLEELHIVNARADHLQSLQRMPRLRSLAVDGYHCEKYPRKFTTFFVQWLGVRMEEEWYSTLVSLVRACAASLRVLEIKCGLKDFPKLSQGLQEFRLRSLRRLLLVRRHPAAGDNKACDLQRAAIQRVLPEAQVICSECNEAFRDETW